MKAPNLFNNQIDGWAINESIENSDNNQENPSIVKSNNNHIYFYSNVEKKSCLDLNKLLLDTTEELLQISHKYGFNKNEFSYNKPKIYLHINSYGGSLISAISSMDTIQTLKDSVDIITIIEGGCASAATLLSIVGTKRLITKNSFILIHQISSQLYGKYNELVDDMKNCDTFMNLIKKIYSEYSEVPTNEIDKILKHDIWWDADVCLKYKLVDKII